MSRRKQLSELEKGKICALKEEEKSISYIAERLKRSRKVVSAYLKLGDAYGKKSRSGWPCTISGQVKRSIIKASRKKR
jgi:IS30 family transposase